MLGWLYRILIGKFVSCNHQWEVIKEGQYFYNTEGVSEDSVPDGHYYYLKCKHCGEMKQKKF